jgi:predicted  nucleic acid-binding Zn-ribbon protein
MGQVQSLYRLQQTDTEIQQKKQRLGQVIRAQKETEALLAARRRAQKASVELQRWQTRQTDLTLELEGLNQKAQRSEKRLYSGNVKNPKELSDLQQEIDSLGRRRATLEDKLLEAMIMIEEAEAEKEAADEALADIESEWEQSQARLKQEQDELATRLNELSELRQQQLPSVPAGALAEYEAIKQERSGLAVVRLKRNICQGCQLTVSAQKVKEAQEGELVYCGSCGRILNPF